MITIDKFDKAEKRNKITETGSSNQGHATTHECKEERKNEWKGSEREREREEKKRWIRRRDANKGNRLEKIGQKKIIGTMTKTLPPAPVFRAIAFPLSPFFFDWFNLLLFIINWINVVQM